MRSLFFALIALLVLAGSAWGFTSYENSPNSWENSRNNWENSSNNWKNSPNNWKNSPTRYNNKRIIRDNRGNPQGYMVPKDNGGANMFDMQGNRRMYVPGHD